MVVVEAPLVGKVQAVVQVAVVLVQRFAGRRRVVPQKIGVVALVQIQAIQACPQTVASAGVVLV